MVLTGVGRLTNLLSLLPHLLISLIRGSNVALCHVHHRHCVYDAVGERRLAATVMIAVDMPINNRGKMPALKSLQTELGR